MVFILTSVRYSDRIARFFFKTSKCGAALAVTTTACLIYQIWVEQYKDKIPITVLYTNPQLTVFNVKLRLYFVVRFSISQITASAKMAINKTAPDNITMLNQNNASFSPDEKNCCSSRIAAIHPTETRLHIDPINIEAFRVKLSSRSFIF